MNNVAYESTNGRRGNLLPWFWIGAGVGFILSTAAVIVTAEITRKRYRPTPAEQIEDEILLVEDLTYQLKESLESLTGHLAPQTSYRDSSSERIRFGLAPGQTGAGSTGWYTGEDDPDYR